MRRKRKFVEGTAYHVTSRTNDKIRVFENKLGRKIMLMTLQDAKDKYRFRLANFCIMPTHIHLLIEPGAGTCLSRIMQWIKTRSAKWYNSIHGSSDHMWGERFFARAIKDEKEYHFLMNYIDQNPVVVKLALTPEDWKASGAYYRAKNIPGLVDLSNFDQQPYIKLLSPVPPLVSRLLPQAQLDRIIKYFGAYAEAIERLYKLVPTIPRLGEASYLRNPSLICLHYSTGTADYFIYEYDGIDTLYGMVRTSIYPNDPECRRFSLTKLKKNQFLELDLSWEVTVTKFGDATVSVT